MVGFLKKIALYFARKIHLSKLKVILSIPILLTVLASFLFEIDWNNKKFSVSKDSHTYKEFITVLILLLLLILIDVTYEFIEGKRKEREDIREIELLSNPNVSDSIKESYLKRKNKTLHNGYK